MRHHAGKSCLHRVTVFKIKTHDMKLEMSKQIEEITDEDLQVLWPAIGGAPHLFSHGKDELQDVLINGGLTADSGLTLDYYSMAAIVDILRRRGFESRVLTEDQYEL